MLDYSFFKEIGLSENERLLKFFTLFLDSVPRYLFQLEKAIELGDTRTFREINHKLRPNLMYFRNPEVEEAVRYLKGDQPIEHLRTYFPRLKEQVTKIIRQVETEKVRLQDGQ